MSGSSRSRFTPAAVSVAPSKMRSICIWTPHSYTEWKNTWETKKAGHDKWKDYSQDIYSFNADLQALGFELVLSLGEPGTGKIFRNENFTPQ
jgi:hypothetical protein